MKEKILLHNHYFKMSKRIRKFLKSDVGRGIRRVGEMALMDSPFAADYLAAKEAVRGVKRGSGLYTGPGMYTGMGEYSANNIIQSQGSNDVVPLFASAAGADEGVIISKREYVSEIYGPPLTGVNLVAPFVLQSFAINPGLEGTFPWLSQIACNYDEYTIKQLIFTFKSTTTESSNTTNGQVGTIIMATNYNAAASNFTDKVTMLQYAHSNSDRITNSIQHGVECDPSKLSGSVGEYVRNNPVVTGQDLKTYDHGRFQIAIANCAYTYANVSLGELWVSYTIELRKPKFYSGLSLNIQKDIFVSQKGTESLTNFMGPTPLRAQQNNIGIQLSFPSVNQYRLTFPAAYRGNLKIMIAMGSGSLNNAYQAYSDVVFAGFPSGSPSGNVQLVDDLYGCNGEPGEINDSPTNLISCSSTQEGWLLICHIRVDIATNSIDNSITFQFTPTAPVGTIPSQGYIECSEYNAGYSYKATGLGTSDAPVFINTSGVVTLP